MKIDKTNKFRKYLLTSLFIIFMILFFIIFGKYAREKKRNSGVDRAIFSNNPTVIPQENIKVGKYVQIVGNEITTRKGLFKKNLPITKNMFVAACIDSKIKDKKAIYLTELKGIESIQPEDLETIATPGNVYIYIIGNSGDVNTIVTGDCNEF